MSGRAIGLVVALGWALVGPRRAAFAAAPDGGAAGPPPAAPPACASLDACLTAAESLPARRRPGVSLEGEKDALESALRGYGKAAIPGLLRLLAGPEPETREIAALSLSDIDGLTPTDLPDLQRAFEAHQSRLAGAIASTGAPEAGAVLYAALKANPYDYWIPFGFERLGREGVPTLMEAFHCHDRAASPLDPFARTLCDMSLIDSVAAILERLGPEAGDAVPRLSQIVRDKHRSPAVLLPVINVLGRIGPAAASTAPALRALARTNRDYGMPVELALLGMKLPDAGQVVAARLAHASGREVDGLLSELAKLGPGGQPAEPQILAHLGNPEWETRTRAARALGYLGDRRLCRRSSPCSTTPKTGSSPTSPPRAWAASATPAPTARSPRSSATTGTRPCARPPAKHAPRSPATSATSPASTPQTSTTSSTTTRTPAATSNLATPSSAPPARPSSPTTTSAALSTPR
ncbi:MAG TPA: hypothetical protein VKZ18_08510 [Polyangia bacterium]|nr:hypothetical protein [Polyangia bacterium]